MERNKKDWTYICIFIGTVIIVFLVTFYIYSSIINELKSFAETRKD